MKEAFKERTSQVLPSVTAILFSIKQKSARGINKKVMISFIYETCLQMVDNCRQGADNITCTQTAT